jgi:hypothetical protein
LAREYQTGGNAMSRDTSLTFREAVNAQETGEAFLILLEIDHDDLSEPIRVTSDGVDTTSNGNIYTSYPFDLQLPDDTEGNIPTAQLTIDNIDRVIVESLRSISTYPTVTIKIVLASDPNTIEAEFTNFELREPQYNALLVSGKLMLKSFFREPYPGDLFLPSTFPGVF